MRFSHASECLWLLRPASARKAPRSRAAWWCAIRRVPFPGEQTSAARRPARLAGLQQSENAQ